MRKIKMLLLALLISFPLNILSVLDVRAAESVMPPSDFGNPIEINTYREPDGSIITEKIYFIPDDSFGNISLYSTSGQGWYKNEKEHYWDEGLGKKMVYYAQGYFKWGDGKVSVTDARGNVENVPSNVIIKNKKTTSGTGKYGMIFNNYAYVEFSFTAQTPYNFERDFSVTIRISESGNNI